MKSMTASLLFACLVLCAPIPAFAQASISTDEFVKKVALSDVSACDAHRPRSRFKEISQEWAMPSLRAMFSDDFNGHLFRYESLIDTRSSLGR